MATSDNFLYPLLPPEWRQLLDPVIRTPGFQALADFLEEEYRTQTVFPPREDLFHAFRITKPDQVKVVLLGQDPYHEFGQAHGLAFSVRDGIKFPPSLRNIFKELQDDLGTGMPASGDLTFWGQQGVLLLNTVLTVRAHLPGSHQKRGWEEFTDAVIRAVSQQYRDRIFVLWGSPAQKKISLIDQERHTILCSAHPSPFSAYRGFFGSKPFSTINRILKQHRQTEICWSAAESAFRQPSLFE